MSTGHDYLGAGSVTDVARMLMQLMSEVWIMRDRQIITEYLLETRGSITREDIDNFAAPPELAQRVEAERERFARLILGAPISAEKRSVEEILERAGYAKEGQAAA